MKKIGFIGLGHMGMPMALGLQQAGHAVLGFDLYPKAVQEFEMQGGQTANLEELASSCDVIITMLPKPQALLDIYHPSSAFIKAIHAKTLLIDCSTVGPIAALKWHQIAKDHGLISVDAPVSGGVRAASSKTLSFMLGGKDEAVIQTEELLKSLGQKFIRTGAAGH